MENQIQPAPAEQTPVQVPVQVQPAGLDPMDMTQATPLTPEEQQQVEKFKSEMTFTNAQQIISYGAEAQSRMSSFSDSVLGSVRSRDMGEVGALLAELTADVRSFDKSTKPPTGIYQLFGGLRKHVMRLQAQFAKVETNVSHIMAKLEGHSRTLSKDVYIFDQQYKENWDYFKQLTLYITAGEEKLREMIDTVLPAEKMKAEASGSQVEMQKYKDLEQQVVRFEQKIHDLKLSRMISIQFAPQIRLVQGNSITMVEKIQSTIVNTLPLWKNQMVLALGIAHTQQALDAQRSVTDATNALLRKNSEMLKQSSSRIATESQRGIIDIETIREANNNLFATLEDLTRIQIEGRQKRLAAEQELKTIEAEFKQKMLDHAKNSKSVLSA